jgi:uncharacterized protein with PIN domain
LSLYLDTSCLLKQLFAEPESPRVAQIVAQEDHVVVSTLARLETIVQMHARVSGGLLPRATARSLLVRMERLLGQAPYELVRAPTDLVDQAADQIRLLPKDGYCPTLDRLHLAVMQAFDLTRLLTNDDAQARAARALGFSVSFPR